MNNTTQQSCNPIALLPGSKDALFRAIFDGVRVTQDRSTHAFSSVADGLATYGKASHTTWDFDKREAGEERAPVSAIERQDKRQDGSWVTEFVPVAPRTCNPAPMRSDNVLPGCRVKQTHTDISDLSYSKGGNTAKDADAFDRIVRGWK